MQPSPTMLLKTNGEEMAILSYATIYMKIKGLSGIAHDMYEKNGLSSSRRSKTWQSCSLTSRQLYAAIWRGKLAGTTIRRRARRPQLGVARLRAEWPATTQVAQNLSLQMPYKSALLWAASGVKR